MRWLAAGLLWAWLSPILAQYEGLWQGRFAGVALVIEGREVSLVQVTQDHAWPLDTFVHDADGGFDTGDGRRYRFQRVDGRLDILDARDQLFLSFVPTDSLPPVQSPTGDPATVFDVFWASFAENYALFDLAGVDWAAERHLWREQAMAAGSPGALFDHLAGLIAPLDDRHTTLVRPEAGQLFRSGPASDPFWRGQENAFLDNIARHYLGQPLQTRGADPRLRFGILPGDVGYLSVSNFLDASGLPDFATTLERVLEPLQQTRGLVIDFRFNPGGIDRNTRTLLERILPPSRTLAYVRERRLSGPLPAAFDAPEVRVLSPANNAFHRRPMVFLTAHDTASAAETVLLAVMDLPRAVQVGEVTAGVFSNLLVRYLPNGWYATLSNERYYSLDGISYERAGIAPHIDIAQSDYDFINGVDPAVDAALAVIDAQPEAVDAPATPGTGISGLWYDPARDGEGWHLQRVDDDRVFVTFYTFDPDGSGAQDWLVGLGEEVDGELVLDELLTARGGRFGADASALAVETVPWGRGVMRFEGCDGAVASLSGPDSHRGFVFRLRPLSRIPGLGCGSGNVGAPALAGSWYVPSRPGEGWLISPSGADDVVVSWYTFDEAGRRRWLIGTGRTEGSSSLVVPNLFRAFGATWGHGFRPEDATSESLGAFSVSLQGCDTAEVSFTPPGQAPLRFSARRLTHVAGIDYPADCTASD